MDQLETTLQFTKEQTDSLDQFEGVVRIVRPKLHKYCARMTGSVIDGEDVLQTALFKAFEALSNNPTIENPEAWLFKIAHNSAMDFFRSRTKHEELKQAMLMADSQPTDPEPKILTDDLKQLNVLPPLQRSVLLLRELFGYSAEEVAHILETSVSAVKSALHRGRESLKKATHTAVENLTPKLSSEDVNRLKKYAELFNLREFDLLRNMLTEEVKLDLVDKSRRTGKQKVGNYFSNYRLQNDWYMEPGFIENQPAILAFAESNSNDAPLYFILLTYADNELKFIRDFRYARYVMDGVEWRKMDA